MLIFLCCSGSLGKIKKRWEFTAQESTGEAYGKHEREWNEIECVQEAVEAVSAVYEDVGKDDNVSVVRL